MAFWDRQPKADMIRAYKEVFSSDKGKLVLHDLMKTFHVLNSTMDTNAHELAYKEGGRSVVLRILKTINMNATEIEKLLNEQDKK